MPSAESEADTEAPENAAETVGDAEAEGGEVVDEARSALLEALSSELGDVLAASHLEPGRDLWIRVESDAWTETADYLRNRQRFRFFDWLSAIDWMPSPFGRSLNAAVDVEAEAEAAAGDSADDSPDEGGYTGTGADGVTGGNTRFQVFARVHSLSTGLGLIIKSDVGEVDGDLSIGTWVDTYPGAAWHEREVHEMFGIRFAGNDDMRHLYLPGDFEGHPLRKDYPLLARLVKPWPGIVDVEPMPDIENPEADGSGNG